MVSLARILHYGLMRRRIGHDRWMLVSAKSMDA